MTRTEILENHWEEFLKEWNLNVGINTIATGDLKKVDGYTVGGHSIPTLEEAFWCWYVMSKLRP